MSICAEDSILLNESDEEEICEESKNKDLVSLTAIERPVKIYDIHLIMEILIYLEPKEFAIVMSQNPGLARKVSNLNILFIERMRLHYPMYYLKLQRLKFKIPTKVEKAKEFDDLNLYDRQRSRYRSIVTWKNVYDACRLLAMIHVKYGSGYSSSKALNCQLRLFLKNLDTKSNLAIISNSNFVYLLDLFRRLCKKSYLKGYERLTKVLLKERIFAAAFFIFAHYNNLFTGFYRSVHSAHFLIGASYKSIDYFIAENYGYACEYIVDFEDFMSLVKFDKDWLSKLPIYYIKTFESGNLEVHLFLEEHFYDGFSDEIKKKCNEYIEHMAVQRRALGNLLTHEGFTEDEAIEFADCFLKLYGRPDRILFNGKISITIKIAQWMFANDFTFPESFVEQCYIKNKDLYYAVVYMCNAKRSKNDVEPEMMFHTV